MKFETETQQKVAAKPPPTAKGLEKKGSRKPIALLHSKILSLPATTPPWGNLSLLFSSAWAVFNAMEKSFHYARTVHIALEKCLTRFELFLF